MGNKSKEPNHNGLLTHKYGKPQGNEMVYGHDIIRRIDTFEFRLVDRFKTNKAAQMAYDQWMKENYEKV